jgi:hypothetical protein
MSAGAVELAETIAMTHFSIPYKVLKKNAGGPCGRADSASPVSSIFKKRSGGS